MGEARIRHAHDLIHAAHAGAHGNGCLHLGLGRHGLGGPNVPDVHRVKGANAEQAYSRSDAVAF